MLRRILNRFRRNRENVETSKTNETAKNKNDNDLPGWDVFDDLSKQSKHVILGMWRNIGYDKIIKHYISKLGEIHNDEKLLNTIYRLANLCADIRSHDNVKLLGEMYLGLLKRILYETSIHDHLNILYFLSVYYNIENKIQKSLDNLN